MLNPEARHDNLGGLTANEEMLFSDLAGQFDGFTPEGNEFDRLESSLDVGATALSGQVEDAPFELTDEDLAFLGEAGVDTRSLTGDLTEEETAALHEIDNAFDQESAARARSRLAEAAIFAAIAEHETMKHLNSLFESDDEDEKDLTYAGDKK